VPAPAAIHHSNVMTSLQQPQEPSDSLPTQETPEQSPDLMQSPESSQPQPSETSSSPDLRLQAMQLLSARMEELSPGVRKLARLLSEALHVEPPETSEVIPGWSPNCKDTDVHLLARVELWVGKTKLPICTVQQSLPSILRASMISAAPEALETAAKAAILSPLMAEFHSETQKLLNANDQTHLLTSGLPR
jgi:hypothetical protein